MSEAQMEVTKSRDAAWQVFAGVAVAAVAVMGVAFLTLHPLVASEGWSTFGEVYGAVVGSFFAAMAFAGVILTVHLQRVEMRAALQEIRRAAEAQEASEKALASQVRALRQSARLTAATALLEHRERVKSRLLGIQQGGDVTRHREVNEQIEKAFERLQGIVDEIETESQG